MTLIKLYNKFHPFKGAVRLDYYFIVNEYYVMWYIQWYSVVFITYSELSWRIITSPERFTITSLKYHLNILFSDCDFLIFFSLLSLHDHTVCTVYVCLWCVYLCVWYVWSWISFHFWRVHTIFNFRIFHIFERSHTLLRVCVNVCISMCVNANFLIVFFVWSRCLCVYDVCVYVCHYCTVGSHC